jgi:hypothetical protein
MTDLEDQAIKFSINGKWDEAIKINLLIFKKNLKDIDAINRLTFAYIQKGNTPEAKKMAILGLKIDKYNVMAKKNLELLSNSSRKIKLQSECLDNRINFIENPGSVKLITLICPGDKKIISNIRNGAELNLKIRKRKISAMHCENYIGCFPDDLSRKFISLIDKGYKYELYFKSFSSQKICVLLREILKT